MHTGLQGMIAKPYQAHIQTFEQPETSVRLTPEASYRVASARSRNPCFPLFSAGILRDAMDERERIRLTKYSTKAG